MLLLAAIALGLPPLSPLPAAAAPTDVEFELEQSSTDGPIGTEVTLTATLSVQDGPLPELPGGWFVEFSGDRNGGWSSGPIRAVEGEATYRTSSPVGAEETITARVANPDCAAAGMTDSVEHTWWTPEISLGEGSGDGSTLEGDEFELSGIVRKSGVAVPEAAVAVTVNGLDGTAGPRELPAVTTNSDGVFSVTWDQGDANLEEVEITATASDGFEAHLVTSHVWNTEEGHDLRLSANTEPRLGNDLTARAALFIDDEQANLASYAPVNYWVDDDWEETEAEDFSYSYPSPTAQGWQVLGVQTVDIPVHGGLAVHWSQPTITFLAPDSSSLGDAAYSARVLVTDRGRPVSFAWLEFRVSGDPEPRYAVTDYDGIAQVEIDGEPGDSRTIEVTEDLGEESPDYEPATASTTHSWVSIPTVEPTISLSPSWGDPGSESRVGTQVPFTAHVTDGNQNPLPNWNVDFSYPDNVEEPFATVRTDADGRASVTLARSGETSLWVIAAATAACSAFPVEGWGFHYWWETQLDLTPKAAQSQARQNVTFTAEVARTIYGEGASGLEPEGQLGAESSPPSRSSLPSPPPVRPTAEMQGPVTAAAIPEGMAPLANQLVRFTLSNPRCELPVAVREARTNTDGIAQVTMTRSGPGTDTVRAEEVGVFDPASDTTTHEWTPASPAPQSITLTQSSETSRVGSSVTITATVYDVDRPNGRAAAGTPVTFRGTSPDRTVRTNRNGIARLTFTGSGTETSVISATAPYGCGVVISPPIRHRWFVPESVPPQVTPSPTVVTEPPVVIISEPPILDEPSPDGPEPSDEPIPEPTDEPTDEPTPEPTNEPTPEPTTQEPTDDLPATSTMVDGPEVGRPGGDIQLSGTGCRPGEHVTVQLGDSQLGETRAAGDGTFYLRAAVPDLPLGRYVIHSSCGTTIGDPNVDITAPQVDRAGGALATAGLTTGSILVFFVLVAKGVISFLPRRPY